MVDVVSSIDKVTGFSVAGVHCGLKKDGALDFALIISDSNCATGAVFTTNRVKAACVLADMDKLSRAANRIRAVAVNTRSANACTGELGLQNAQRTAELVADKIGCEADQVLVLSTGVIGMHLPMDKIARGVELAYQSLGNCWQEAAAAIMTTDTRPKYASVKVTTDSGQTYTIAGISKGAGMIAPNMATMLGVIVTDAALTVEQAQQTLFAAADVSYNRIVVDGDMSTNDTVFLLANGASGVQLQTSDDMARFQEALTALCSHLAREIVRDGEGVTKFVTVRVIGAPDDESARRIANTMATSALVKTAFFGQDANWGRLVAAAGRAGVPLEPQNLRLWIAEGEGANGDLLLFSAGMPTDYQEEDAAAIMRNDVITVTLDCGMGHGSSYIWTCDLSHEYVSINADYRT